MSIELKSPSMETSPESLVGHPCLLFLLGHERSIQTPKIFLTLLFVSLRTNVFSPIYQESAVSSDPQRVMISLLAGFCTYEVAFSALILFMAVLLRSSLSKPKCVPSLGYTPYMYLCYHSTPCDCYHMGQCLKGSLNVTRAASGDI